MDFETEEQQVEAIKQWWKENSAMIVTGISVGVASIFGWQYYQDQSIKHTEQASIIYETVATNVQSSGTINDQQTRVNTLAAEYKDTPYASLSALLLAKQHLAAGEPVKAQTQLQWVIDNARQDELRYLAKIRLARVLLTNAQVDQALLLLNETYPESFRSIALELKGDALVTQGNKALAHQAYKEALQYTVSSRLLQLKIDDLGEAADISTDNTSSTEPSA